MRITLISPYPDITSFGLRTLSALLRREGYDTRIVFMPDPFGDDLMMGVQRYDESVLDELAALCEGSALVGLTLMTNFFDGAIQITRRLREKGVGAPIIWGGVHPTIRPQECLEHADIVCIGDGEETLLELAGRIRDGKPYKELLGLWVRDADSVQRNPVRTLCQELDSYPTPDYSHHEHYIMLKGGIVPLTPEITREFLSKGTVSIYLGMIGYQTMTGRGCPHQCSYCINDTIKSMYGAKGYLRWRSTEHVMAELERVRREMPYVGFIWISDDAFFARKTEDLREFCRQYKERIGLPFTCLASPLTVTEEKMEMLVDTGLVYLQMGIQSGSPHIQQLFNRANMPNEKIMRAVRTINKYKDKLFPPSYDFILDVPYESERDRIESLRLIAELPKPYRLQPFSLVLYPETKLYKMAKADGLVKDEMREIYNKSYTMREPNYVNLLIALARTGKFPSPILKALVNQPLVNILNSRALKPLFGLLYRALKAAKGAMRALGLKRV